MGDERDRERVREKGGRVIRSSSLADEEDASVDNRRDPRRAGDRPTAIRATDLLRPKTAEGRRPVVQRSASQTDSPVEEAPASAYGRGKDRVVQRATSSAASRRRGESQDDLDGRSEKSSHSSKSATTRGRRVAGSVNARQMTQEEWDEEQEARMAAATEEKERRRSDKDHRERERGREGRLRSRSSRDDDFGAEGFEGGANHHYSRDLSEAWDDGEDYGERKEERKWEERGGVHRRQEAGERA